MKLQAVRSWLAAALCVLVSISVDVQQCNGAPAASKLVDMRETIVPAWPDVAASGVTKITPSTLMKFWNRLEVEDIERFALKLVLRNKRSKAKQAIEEYYDVASACLNASGAGPSLKKAAFESLMPKLRKCIAMDGRMPKFVVEDGANATVSDFVDATNSSGDAGMISSGGPSATPSPVSEPATMSPSPAPTSTPVREQPTASPTLSPSTPPPSSATNALPPSGASASPSSFEPLVVTVTPTPTPVCEPTHSPPSPDPTPAPTPEATPTPTTDTTPVPTPKVTPAPTTEVTLAPSLGETPAPTVVVTPSPTKEETPAPTAEVTLSPSTEMTPAPTPNVTPAPTLSVTVPPPQAQIRPALNRVPAMSVLDPDGSGDVSMAEWEAYVASLKTVALKLVAGIKEPRSKTLLDNIVTFHYDTLWRCIEKHVAASPTQDFASLVTVIDSHCYVKFRYSLFAGMPPFEFIARDAPAVPASFITKWIARSLVVARADMTGAQALAFPQATLTHLDNVLRCVAVAMQAAPTQAIDKTAYHHALAQLDQCSAK